MIELSEIKSEDQIKRIFDKNVLNNNNNPSLEALLEAKKTSRPVDQLKDMVISAPDDGFPMYDALNMTNAEFDLLGIDEQVIDDVEVVYVNFLHDTEFHEQLWKRLKDTHISRTSEAMSLKKALRDKMNINRYGQRQFVDGHAIYMKRKYIKKCKRGPDTTLKAKKCFLDKFEKGDYDYMPCRAQAEQIFSACFLEKILPRTLANIKQHAEDLQNDNIDMVIGKEHDINEFMNKSDDLNMSITDWIDSVGKRQFNVNDQ